MRRPLLSIDARLLFSSGIGTYLQNLLKRIRFEELGLKVRIYVHTEGAAVWMRQYQPDAEVRYCPHWVFGFKEQLFWAKELRGGAFWCPQFNVPWVGIEKLIVTVHDAFPFTSMADWFYRFYARLAYARIRKKADAVLTVSEFSKSELLLQAKIPESSIHVVPNGVDPHWFTSAPAERPYPFDYFVFISSFYRQKNTTRFLRAYEKSKLPQRLVCVGPYKYLEKKEPAAWRLLKKLSNRLSLIERGSDAELRALVKHSKGLIFPSLYEGFGFPPLEAMAARVPVLVSQTAAMPEVCGESALYCDPYSVENIAEGLCSLAALTGEELERRLQLGSEHASQFNWDIAAQKTLQVFRDVLA